MKCKQLGIIIIPQYNVCSLLRTEKDLPKNRPAPSIIVKGDKK
jgi:hypothetical protein